MRLSMLFSEAVPQGSGGPGAPGEPEGGGDEVATGKKEEEEVETQVSRMDAPMNELMTYLSGLPGDKVAEILAMIKDMDDKLEVDKGEWYKAIEAARMTGSEE